MVPQDNRRGHAGRNRVAGGLRKILLRIALGGFLSLVALSLSVLWILPALGRRGDLNVLVEEALRSVLSVPVSIGRIETDLLAEFSLTSVSTVEAQSESRFEFHSRRLTLFYRPLELILQGRVREITALEPSLFLDLDRDLSGIVRLDRGDAEGKGRGAGSARSSVRVDRFRITGGTLAIRVGGRDLVLGDLDLNLAGLGGPGNVSFHLGADFLGSRITLEGVLVRLPHPVGAPARVQIQTARVEVAELNLRPLLSVLFSEITGSGLLSFSGSASGIWPEEVVVQLSSRLRQGEASPPGAPRFSDGEARLDLALKVRGELERVQFKLDLEAKGDLEARSLESGSFSAFREELSLLVAGEFENRRSAEDGARVYLETIRLEAPGWGKLDGGGVIELGGEDPVPDLELHLQTPSLSRLRDHVPGSQLRGILLPLEGALDLRVHVGGTLERPELAADFDLRQASLDLPSIELQVPAFTARGSARIARAPDGPLDVQLDATFHAPELAVYDLIETADREPITVSGTVLVATEGDSSRVQLDLKITTPSTGPVSLKGAVIPHGDFHLDLLAGSLPNERFLSTFLRDPFRESLSFLEDARFSGSSVVEIGFRRSEGEAFTEGIYRTRDLGIRTAVAELEMVSLDLPFRWGEAPAGVTTSPVPGFLEVGHLRFRSLEHEGFRVPFVLAHGSYRIVSGALSVGLFGGQVELGAVEFRAAAREGERLRLSLLARELRLEEIGRLLGLEDLPGRVSLEVRDLALSDERLAIDGLLALDIFSGRVELSGLSIDYPLTPYRVYSLASGTVRGLDLGQLGRQFRFGLVSGVLEGWVRNLIITDSGVAGFEADLKTVRKKGVPQYIDKSAIESIQRILAGPFGFLEATFFSKFRYAGFGFYCSLENGRFRLRGKYPIREKEYIMYSHWYQIPRVDIINNLPGIDYDWDQIRANLGNIYSGPSSGGKDGTER